MTAADVREKVSREVDCKLAERRRDFSHSLFLQGMNDREIADAIARVRQDDAVLGPWIVEFVTDSIVSKLTKGESAQ